MYLFDILKSNDLKMSKKFTKDEVKEMKSIFNKKIKPNFKTIDNSKGVNLRSISSGDTFFISRLENGENNDNFIEDFDLEEIYSMLDNKNLKSKKKSKSSRYILHFNRIDELPRFFTLSTGKVVALELLIDTLSKYIYKDYKYINGGICRIIRYDNIEELELNPSLSTKKNLRKVHKRNNRSYPSLIEVDSDIDDITIKLIANSFNVKTNIIKRFKLVGCSTANNIDFNKSVNISKISFDEQKPSNIYKDCKILKEIKEHDILVTHPYESYDIITNFLKEGINNKNITSIYQTIYRVSSLDSKIIELLCKGAKEGKKVYVLVEIKARGNEGMNLHIIDKLTSAGVKVIKCPKDIKVHSKALIMKEVKNGDINWYTHIGTGNYNEKTSKIYVDYSYLTYNSQIGKEVMDMFTNLKTGILSPPKDGKVFNYKVGSVRNIIDKELTKLEKVVDEGKDVKCTIKVNGLSDFDIVNRIYESAMNGVKFDIIVRGECIITPHKNINVKSIVGRYLEHSRIYRFEIKNEYDKLYLSTADLMTRNLSRRIESIIEIKDKTIKDELILDLSIYNHDYNNSFIETKPGKWKHYNYQYPIDVQKFMYIKNKNKDTH